MRESRELNWECTVKQAGSVPSSAIGSVLETMPGNVLENVLGTVLGSDSEYTWERLESLLGSV